MRHGGGLATEGGAGLLDAPSPVVCTVELGGGLLGLGGEKLHGHLRGRFGNWVRLRSLNWWLCVSVRISGGCGGH